MRLRPVLSIEARADLEEIRQILVGAHGLFMEAWGEGLYLDPDRWEEKAGGIEEVIRKEEGELKRIEGRNVE